MTIASEITRINNNIASAYTACSSKGATMPSTQNSANLATCINSISSGGGGSDIGIAREVSSGGVYRAPASNFTFSVPSNATKLGEHSMHYAFNNCAGVTSVDLSSITTIDKSYALGNAFFHCINLTNVDLGSLTTVSGQYAMSYAFDSCTKLANLDLGSLTTVSNIYAMDSAFSGCSNLESVDLSNLSTVDGGNAMKSTFSRTGLTSVGLSNLTTVNGTNAMKSTFSVCPDLESVDLGGLTTVKGNNAMDSAFSGCSNLESVLFTNLQTIGEDSSSANCGHFSSCFNGCSKLTTITFPNLEKIYCTGSGTNANGTFSNNNYIQKMYFPKLDTITYGSGTSSTNQYACKKVFYGCTALTELHFAAANQSAIEASPGYSTAWGRGAGNVTIYFDL